MFFCNNYIGDIMKLEPIIFTMSVDRKVGVLKTPIGILLPKDLIRLLSLLKSCIWHFGIQVQHIENVMIASGKLGQGMDILIGMDIITLGDFAITNYNNKTVFSFRFPSSEVIDFVKSEKK